MQSLGISKHFCYRSKMNSSDEQKISSMARRVVDRLATLTPHQRAQAFGRIQRKLKSNQEYELLIAVEKLYGAAKTEQAQVSNADPEVNKSPKLSIPLKPPAAKRDALGKRPPKKVKLLLISRRGTKTERAMECAACHRSQLVTWHYKESTRGSVNVCERCKPRLFDRSFGRKDALDFCQLGGGFESNRRKF